MESAGTFPGIGVMAPRVRCAPRESVMDEGSTTTRLQQWLERLQAGDDQAREELIQIACERLRELTHRMLRRYPTLQRWEQTGDVLNNASMRLYRSLKDVKPDTVGQFFGLAATQIRRQLLDLCDHHFGPHGDARHHITDAKGADAAPGRVEVEPARRQPGSVEAWNLFHKQVEKLPEVERQVVDLLFYQGLTQAEAAEILAVSVKSIQRRWQAARLALHDALDGQWPE